MGHGDGAVMRWPLVVGVLLLLAPAAIGEGHGRDVQGDWDSTRFTVRSVGEGNDTVTASFHRAVHRLDVIHEVDGSSRWIGIEAVAVVEFQDNDGDGRYSLGDPLVERLALASLSAPFVRGEDQGRNLSMEVRYHLRWPSGPLVLSLDADPSGRLTWNASVEDFSFQTGNRTHLALEMRIHGNASAHADRLVARADDHALTWSWAMDNRTRATVQPYGADPPQVLVVLSQTASARHLFTTEFTVTPIEDPVGKDRVLGDWPVFVIGLVAGLAVIFVSIKYAMGDRI